MLFKVTNTSAGPKKKVSDTEFKAFYPAINENMAWDTLEPFIQEAEDLEIIPAIGLSFYNVLNTEYQATDEIADATKAHTFRLLRTALAHYAIYIGLPKLNVRIGDTGTNESNVDAVSPIRQWVYNVNRWETARTAFRYMDMALAHMESQVIANNTDYDTFANDDAYTESKELLIPNAQSFQRYYNLQTSRRSYTVLRPYIRKAEQIHLLPLLGPLLDEIKTQHTNNSLSSANADMLGLIRPLLAEHTIGLAVPDLNFVNDGDGWRVVESQYGMTRPTQGSLSQSLQQLLTRAEQNAAHFEVTLKNELYARLDEFPTFRDSTYNELTQDLDGDGTADIDEIDHYGDQEAGAVII